MPEHNGDAIEGRALAPALVVFDVTRNRDELFFAIADGPPRLLERSAWRRDQRRGRPVCRARPYTLFFESRPPVAQSLLEPRAQHALGADDFVCLHTGNASH